MPPRVRSFAIGVSAVREIARHTREVWHQPVDLVPRHLIHVLQSAGARVLILPFDDDPDAYGPVLSRLDGLVLQRLDTSPPASERAPVSPWRADDERSERALADRAAMLGIPTISLPPQLADDDRKQRLTAFLAAM
jgi:hypothetical protein